MEQAAKVIVVGHKILNLEELFAIAAYDSTQPGQKIEVAVDSPLYSELNKEKSKEKALVKDFKSFDEAKNLRKSEARAILAVKLVQLIKLKSVAHKATVDCLVKILNEDLFEAECADFFEVLYSKFEAVSVFPIEKERYILNSSPTCFLAKSALTAYTSREGVGFLNAVLALSLETAEFPAEYFNEYALTLRGRATQGVTQFKNQMLALVADSKKRQQKAELNDTQKQFKISKVFTAHAQLTDRSGQLCNQLQNEINCDEASVFQNKKYKEILKLANEQQEEIYEHLKEQYDLAPLVDTLKSLSATRQSLMGQGEAAINGTGDLFDTYISEILLTFAINKQIED